MAWGRVVRASLKRRQSREAEARDRERLVDLALETSDVFGLFSAVGRRRLSLQAAPAAFASGDFLCREGAAADGAWVILNGLVQVLSADTDGGQARLATLGAGALCGAMSAVDGQPSPHSLMAARPTQALLIPRQALADGLRAEPAVAVALLAMLGARVREAERALAATQAEGLGGQLAAFLLARADDHGVVRGAPAQIAKRMGAPAAAVERKLERWTGSAVVDVARGGVRLKKLPLLRQLAGHPPG